MNQTNPSPKKSARGALAASLLTLMILILVGAPLLAGCSGLSNPAAPDAAPTDLPVVQSDEKILVEGRLVPRKSVQLSFGASGKISEVLVKEGDLVKAGDVLARLGERQPLEAAIANAEQASLNAELELLNSQQALDKLAEQAVTASVEALRRIGEATRRVRDAKYQMDNYTPPASLANLDPFDAVTEMKKKLEEARAAYEPYKNRPENDSTRENLKDDLDQAQSDYNAAVRQLETVIALQTAEADLDQALQDYKTFKAGPKAADVQAAQARISAAQGNLASAKAALASAKAALANLDLVATIDGMLVDFDLIVGEQATPAQPVVTITDYSEWYIETDNLTEFEVVKIRLGQKVSIVLDALPDEQMTGVVDSIGDIFEEKRGDITYTVRIKMDKSDPRFRWGMSVLATFEE